jgi:HK97 family phage major capsid protein/HK97 family phage prohead protease
MPTEKLELTALTRAAPAESLTVEADTRIIEFPFSSELPVERWFGNEVLSHRSGAADLARLNDGGALLYNHNVDEIIGVVERAWMSENRGHARVRFAKTAKADEVFGMVQDGIMRNVSFGYRISEMTETLDDGQPTYTATRWEPFEISLVTVPADPTVGIGRADANEKRPVVLNRAEPEAPPAPNTEKEIEMSDTDASVTDAGVAAALAERARISAISALGTRHGNADLARTLIDSGKSLDEARAAFLESITGKQEPMTSAPSPEIGLSKTESRSFSFLRALNALANPTDRRALEAAAFELECSDAVGSKIGKRAQGIYVPFEVLSRDLTVGTTTAGGHTVATDVMASDFISLLRNRMATAALGARMMSGLVGNVAIPRQTGGATAYWVAEGSAPTESQQAFDQVTLSPKTVGAFTDISRKLLLQSSVDIEALVRSDLATVLALAIDAAAINGSGSSNQPRGILNVSGIGSVVGGTNGAAPDWADMVDLESAVSSANADVGNLAYLTNAKVRGKLKQTEKASSTGQFVWENGNTVNGYNAAVSNQVPSNLTKGSSSGVCSAIVYGNFSDLLVGMWGTLDLTVDPYSQSTSGTMRVVALQDVDVAVRHAESFAAMVDALTA